MGSLGGVGFVQRYCKGSPFKIERGTCVFFRRQRKENHKTRKTTKLEKKELTSLLFHGGFPGFVKLYRHSSKCIIFIFAVLRVFLPFLRMLVSAHGCARRGWLRAALLQGIPVEN